MKTPKINRDEIRKKSITVPVSEKEKEAITQASYEMGVTVSTFVRLALTYFMGEGEID